MAKAARVLAALKRGGWTETRRSGSHRVLTKGDQQRIWAYHDGVDLGGPAMARIARDYGYTLAELRYLSFPGKSLCCPRSCCIRQTARVVWDPRPGGVAP